MDENNDVVGSITNIYNDLLLECCLRTDKFAVINYIFFKIDYSIIMATVGLGG